jgi:hypothetical protein
VPAVSASPIPAGLGQLAGSDPARSDELPDLLARRHPLSYVLALTACGVLAGAKSPTTITGWAADASDRLLLHCGATLRDPDRPYRAPGEGVMVPSAHAASTPHDQRGPCPPASPELDWVEIAERKAEAITFTAPEASEEPHNLRQVKNEVSLLERPPRVRRRLGSLTLPSYNAATAV